MENNYTMESQANASYEMVEVSKLKIDKYQRLLNISLANKISNEFDFNLVGLITVSYREGQYNVIDGQHRVYGATLAKIPMLMCQILKDLSYQEEAQLFNDLNGIRKRVSIYDIYNADIEAGDKQILDIKKCVELNGMSIARKVGENKISAINQLKAIYKRKQSINFK